MPSYEVLLSAVLVLSCGQSDTHRDRQADRITDVAKKFSPATVVGVSNNNSNNDNDNR